MKYLPVAIGALILGVCLYFLPSINGGIEAIKNKPTPSPSKSIEVGAGSTQGGAYYSTTTTQAMFDATRFHLLKTGGGVLGSAVITNATALAPFNLYDGTTTSSHANLATTTLGSFGTGALSGSYAFDSAFIYGLIIEFPSGASPASTTITWQ